MAYCNTNVHLICPWSLLLCVCVSVFGISSRCVLTDGLLFSFCGLLFCAVYVVCWINSISMRVPRVCFVLPVCFFSWISDNQIFLSLRISCLSVLAVDRRYFKSASWVLHVLWYAWPCSNFELRGCIIVSWNISSSHMFYLTRIEYFNVTSFVNLVFCTYNILSLSIIALIARY